MKKKTHAEYVAELAENNPDIEVLGIYCGANVKIPHRCKIDGTVWNATPSNILRGTGCPCCGKIKYSNSRRKTHEEYVEELSQINSNINVLEKYINAKTPILHLNSYIMSYILTSLSNSDKSFNISMNFLIYSLISL